MFVTKKLGTQIDGVACTAAEASRTVTADVTKASSIGFTFALARHIASWMTVQFWLSHDGGTTYGRVVSKDIAAGEATTSDYTEKHTLTNETTEALECSMECQAATHCKAIFAASGDNLDLITVTASMSEEV